MPKTFDSKIFLTKVSRATSIVEYRANDRIFVQGDPADALLYIKGGKVKVSVVSKQGKEAVVAILKDGDFFGEGCLAGQQVRMATAVCYFGVLHYQGEQAGGDSSTSRRTILCKPVHGPSSLTEHQNRGRSGRPVVQLQ
jgi:hypothetical protein